MNDFKIITSKDEYLFWRAETLHSPNGTPLMTPRGKCLVLESFLLEIPVADWGLRNSELEDAEFNLIFYGEDQPEDWKERLYGNDDDLYKAYKSLHVAMLTENGKRRMSRKNIIFNKECCLTWWQLHGDTLTVISRSLDLQRAGLSDPVIINRAAKKLGCKKWRLISLCTHIYENRGVIARRTNENLSI